MHEILERFIGRYQVWRDERVQHNPLNIPALIVAIGIAQTAYDLLVRHNFTWWAGFVIVLNVAFLVLYFRKWPWAWLMLPIWGAMILLQLPSVFDLASRYPLRVQTLLLLHRVSRDEANASKQSMKPTAPLRSKFSAFATRPCRGLSLSRGAVQSPSKAPRRESCQ